jgi:cell division protein FtsA
MTDQDLERIVGLDIGTTKVSCVAAVANDFGGLEIIGVGTAPSHGMARGTVTNMEQARASIVRAVDECRRMAGCRIEDVYVGIAGGHISSHNSHGIAAVRDKSGKVVTDEDKRRAVENAETMNIPQGRIIIQSIPQEYKVDELGGILEPKDMVGVRLEVDVHVITSALNPYQNIVNCVTDAGLNLKEMILESLASAEAVLTSQEMDLGAAVVDIGGGTTDIAVFRGGSVKHSGVVPLGGDSLTRDVAYGLRTSLETAEELKLARGACDPALLGPEPLSYPTLGGAQGVAPPDFFSGILGRGMAGILEGVSGELAKSGMEDDVHEVVMTGGTSLLPGAAELARQILQRSVRLGAPRLDGGLSSMVNDPRYSTAIGLVMYGHRCGGETREPSARAAGGPASLPRRLIRGIRRIFAGG